MKIAKVYFKFGANEKLEGQLILSRGLLIVKAKDNKTYSPSGWTITLA